MKRKQKSKKLDYVYIKLFYINARKKTVSYKLNLAKNANLYYIFHVLLLELVDPKTYIQNIIYYQNQEKDKFEVKKILNQKIQNYLVK